MEQSGIDSVETRIAQLAEKLARLELAVFGPVRVPLDSDASRREPIGRTGAAGQVQAFMAIDPQPTSSGLHGLEWSDDGTPYRWTRDFARFVVDRDIDGGELVELVSLVTLPEGSLSLYCDETEVKASPGSLLAEARAIYSWILPNARSETSVLTIVSRSAALGVDDERYLGIPLVSLTVTPLTGGSRS